MSLVPRTCWRRSANRVQGWHHAMPPALLGRSLSPPVLPPPPHPRALFFNFSPRMTPSISTPGFRPCTLPSRSVQVSRVEPSVPRYRPYWRIPCAQYPPHSSSAMNHPALTMLPYIQPSSTAVTSFYSDEKSDQYHTPNRVWMYHAFIFECCVCAVHPERSLAITRCASLDVLA